MKILDCTLRDGGYHNNWDFSTEVVEKYLLAMSAIGVDFVELGFRTLKSKNCSFRGAMAYTTDSYLETLDIPSNLTVGVMIGASLLYGRTNHEEILKELFPKKADDSKVSLVRIICCFHEFVDVLPVSSWLKDRGYMVGFNIMMASERTSEEFELLASEAQKWPIDVLYFADSMGSIDPVKTKEIVSSIHQNWKGEIGIHAHDNMGKAVQNTLAAAESGATWLDATITGMGRGPGNTQTEYLVAEICEERGKSCNIIPLMELIENDFLPMQQKFRWGKNVYYYLAGKYGIHPTFIQNMQSDNRYSAEDILAAIEYLKSEGGKKFSFDTLESARNFYKSNFKGSWSPEELIEGKEVLILGADPQGKVHHKAIERYITKEKPLVIALNTESLIDPTYIDLRIASHPIRLLADCETYISLKKPLVLPFSMLSKDITKSLENKKVYDYGISIQDDKFEFKKNYCVIPTSLVIAYALAVATSGKASRILLAGFDGYGADDPRTIEMQHLITLYKNQKEAIEMISVTATRYELPIRSIYAM